MGLDLTSFDAALKQYYTDDMVMNLVYKDNPLLAMIPKMENFLGKNLPIPLIYGNPQGRSATFSNAQSRGADSSSQLTDFVLTRNHDYGIATIDNETLEASQGDKGSFLEAATTEINGIINSLSRSLAIALYRDGSGQIGRIVAEPAENVGSFSVTLTETDEITNFEVGQVIVMYANATGGSAKTSNGSDSEFLITAVNRDTGVITFGETYDSSGTIAANDRLFVLGDRGNKIKGLDAWIPSTAPDSTLFFGVDRSADTTRLGGIRYDGSSQAIEEALVNAAVRASRDGARIDYYFMNYAKWAELELSLGAKVQYVDVKGPAQVGFKGIQISGPKGVITCLPDQNCLPDVAFGLQMNTWKLYSLGKAVRVLNSDGLDMLRQASADGVEVRYGYYAQLGCRGPGMNVRVALA